MITLSISLFAAGDAGLALFFELEAGRLLAGAHIQAAMRDDGMIPRLACDRLELAPLFVHFGFRVHERDFACFREDEEPVLVGKEQHLAVAVAARLPLALSVVEADAGEKVA